MMVNFAFFLDVGILILLACTVFLAFRLNVNLRHFRESRFEMEGLVNRLTANVERAEKAIAGLQVSARNSGADLDKKIKESKFLSDELKFMNDAGEGLANRLEKLADTNRELIKKMEETGGVGPNISYNQSGIYLKEPSKPSFHEQTQPSQTKITEMQSGFSIMDREFDDLNDGLDDLNFELDNNDLSSNLQSQAEREFFEAMKQRKISGSHN